MNYARSYWWLQRGLINTQVITLACRTGGQRSGKVAGPVDHNEFGWRDRGGDVGERWGIPNQGLARMAALTESKLATNLMVTRAGEDNRAMW